MQKRSCGNAPDVARDGACVAQAAIRQRHDGRRSEFVALLDFLLKLTRNHERDAEFAGIGMEARQGGDALRLRLREPGPEGGRPITKAKFYFMIAADSTATFGMGNSDGEKDDEDPSVDEGGRANAEGARAREG